MIARQMKTLLRAGAGLARIRELLWTPGRIAGPETPLFLPGGALGLEFRDVTFAYHDDRARGPAGAQAALLVPLARALVAVKRARIREEE